MRPAAQTGTAAASTVSRYLPKNEMDFFVVPIVRYWLLYVWFVIEHEHQEVRHASSTAHPTATQVIQQLREDEKEHLRELVREYAAHYHEERPHQGLGGRLIAAVSDPQGRGPLARPRRLGGLLNHYYREAALDW